MTKVACIGECMIELKQAQGGLYSRGYGGDTLNTANYLARLGADVDYITALGDDPMSEEMLAGWAAEVFCRRHDAPRFRAGRFCLRSTPHSGVPCFLRNSIRRRRRSSPYLFR